MATVTVDAETFLDLVAAAELVVEFVTDSFYVPALGGGPVFAMTMDYQRAAAAVALAVLIKKSELTLLAAEAGYTGKKNNEQRYQRLPRTEAPAEGQADGSGTVAPDEGERGGSTSPLTEVG